MPTNERKKKGINVIRGKYSLSNLMNGGDLGEKRQCKRVSGHYLMTNMQSETNGESRCSFILFPHNMPQDTKKQENNVAYPKSAWPKTALYILWYKSQTWHNTYTNTPCHTPSSLPKQKTGRKISHTVYVLSVQQDCT